MRAFPGQELGRHARRADDLPAAPRLQLDVVDHGADRDVREGQRIPGLDVGLRTRFDLGADLKPRRRSGWALKQVASPGTEPRYVLRNTRTSAYLQLTERDRFLWDLMDGDHRVRDLLFAYSREYGQLALPRIQQLIDQLNGAGLLARAPGETEAGRRTAKDRVIAAMLRMELAVAGLDGGVERIYGRLGWVLFTRVGIAISLLTAIAGLLLFATASGHARLFDVGGAGVLGAGKGWTRVFTAVRRRGRGRSNRRRG